MVFTDPPYNVSLGDHGGQGRGQRRRRIANDALDPVAWEAFVRGWAKTLLAAVDGALYVCMSSKELPLVSRVLAEEGGHWSDTLVWAKDRFVLGRADYQRAYEPLWYGWREGAGHHWCGGRDQSDVWNIDRPSESPLHPTTKPLELVERAIANSSRQGDVVLDPFVGSARRSSAASGPAAAARPSSSIRSTSRWPSGAGSASVARMRSGSMVDRGGSPPETGGMTT